MNIRIGIGWVCLQHPVSLFWSSLSQFSLEKPPLPISHPRTFVGIVHTARSWVWVTPHYHQGVIQLTSLTHLPLSSPPSQWSVQGWTHDPFGINERKWILELLSFSEWHGRGCEVWHSCSHFATMGNTGTFQLTATVPKRKPIKR